MVLEAAEVIGGASRTEHPFAAAPGLGASTGAYLLGLMPPELTATLGLDLPLTRRDPHYFLPRVDGPGVVLGADPTASRDALTQAFSHADADADAALAAEIAALREDLAPTWLTPPLTIEDTAERWVRPELRETFVALCRGSVGDYLDRFGFASELLRAMYAVTDAFPGLYGTIDTPGSGMNFLIHNMCRLAGSGGTWMVVTGGMGAVTSHLAAIARDAGADIRTGSPVERVTVAGGVVAGVELADGRGIAAPLVLVNADAFRLPGLVGRDALGPVMDRIEEYAKRPGTTMKVNLALSDLPRFTCMPEPAGQHGATIHLLSDAPGITQRLRGAFAEAAAGRLPAEPTIEMYIHTATDPSLRDAEGRHSAALFVQWVPNRIAGSSWDREAAAYTDHLLTIVDRFAPGTSDLVVDRQILHPERIESHFGITGGNIHHVDNAFGFADRLPYRLPVDGLYACGAGCHPAGSVIGAAGHNAARMALADTA